MKPQQRQQSITRFIPGRPSVPNTQHSSSSSSPSIPAAVAGCKRPFSAVNDKQDENCPHQANKRLDLVTFANIEELVPLSWKPQLEEEFSKSYFKSIKSFLANEKKVVFPAKENIFRALELTPWDEVRVVILGQDPYHGDGQAHGLSFSVPRGIAKPSSLINIFKEIKTDEKIGNNFKIPSHGNLENWARQGVLMLNTVLTVQAHTANSHKDIGWQKFTDKIITKLNQEKSGLIFVLWGKQAQLKAKSINTGKHSILQSAHPSGLSAHRGFFGCRHFSQINEILEKQHKKPIDWNTE